MNALHSGYGTTMYLPGLMRYVSMLVSQIGFVVGLDTTDDMQRGGPEWMLRLLRNSMAQTRWESRFQGTQVISKGGLAVAKQ